MRREIGLVKKLKDEHIERKYEIEETYQEEFHKNGLKNLVSELLAAYANTKRRELLASTTIACIIQVLCDLHKRNFGVNHTYE
jgi:hypothetical protein